MSRGYRKSDRLIAAIDRGVLVSFFKVTFPPVGVSYLIDVHGASLLKGLQNIGPLDMEELEALEGCIAFIKEALSRGKLEASEFGLFGELSDEKIYVSAGFNA